MRWVGCNPPAAADSRNDALPSRFADPSPVTPLPGYSYLPQPLLHQHHHPPLSLPTMKSFALLTASVLLGGASAEVHKLKLNKVSLAEQLVRMASPQI